MNELTRIADEYFNAFEGRRLYPRPFSLYWLALLLALGLWIWATTRLFAPAVGESDSAIYLVLVFESIFFLSYAVIDKKKRIALRAAHRLTADAPSSAVDETKRSYLCNVFGREASEFSDIAREAQTICTLTESLRPVGDGSLSSLLRRVHDPDHRSRLMNVILAALAILVSLVVVGLGPHAPNVVAVLMSEGFQEELILLMVLSVVAFGMWHALKLIWFNVLELMVSWGARVGGAASFKSKKMNYLIRDLVRLKVFSSACSPKGGGRKLAIQRESRARRRPLRRTFRASGRGWR